MQQIDIEFNSDSRKPLSTKIDLKFQPGLPLPQPQSSNESNSHSLQENATSNEDKSFKQNLDKNSLSEQSYSTSIRNVLKMYLTTDESHKADIKANITKWMNTELDGNSEWIIIHITFKEIGFLKLSNPVSTLRNRFNKDDFDRVCEFRVKDMDRASPTEFLIPIVEKIKEGVTRNIEKTIINYGQQIRAMNALRITEDFDYLSFFFLKEDLAGIYEALKLYDSALAQYDELEALFQNRFNEKWKLNFVEFGGNEIGNHIGSLFDFTKKDYRSLILNKKISEFDFHQYMFSRQTYLLSYYNVFDIFHRANRFVANFENELKKNHLPLLFQTIWTFSAYIDISQLCTVYNQKQNSTPNPKLMTLLGDIYVCALSKLDYIGHILNYFSESQVITQLESYPSVTNYNFEKKMFKKLDQNPDEDINHHTKASPCLKEGLVKNNLPKVIISQENDLNRSTNISVKYFCQPINNNHNTQGGSSHLENLQLEFLGESTHDQNQVKMQNDQPTQPKTTRFQVNHVHSEISALFTDNLSKKTHAYQHSPIYKKANNTLNKSHSTIDIRTSPENGTDLNQEPTSRYVTPNSGASVLDATKRHDFFTWQTSCSKMVPSKNRRSASIKADLFLNKYNTQLTQNTPVQTIKRLLTQSLTPLVLDNLPDARHKLKHNRFLKMEMANSFLTGDIFSQMHKIPSLNLKTKGKSAVDLFPINLQNRLSHSCQRDLNKKKSEANTISKKSLKGTSSSLDSITSNPLEAYDTSSLVSNQSNLLPEVDEKIESSKNDIRTSHSTSCSQSIHKIDIPTVMANPQDIDSINQVNDTQIIQTLREHLLNWLESRDHRILISDAFGQSESNRAFFIEKELGSVFAIAFLESSGYFNASNLEPLLKLIQNLPDIDSIVALLHNHMKASKLPSHQGNLLKNSNQLNVPYDERTGSIPDQSHSSIEYQSFEHIHSPNMIPLNQSPLCDLELIFNSQPNQGNESTPIVIIGGCIVTYPLLIKALTNSLSYYKLYYAIALRIHSIFLQQNRFRGISRIQAILGNLFFQIGLYQKALEFFELSVEQYKKKRWFDLAFSIYSKMFKSYRLLKNKKQQLLTLHQLLSPTLIKYTNGETQHFFLQEFERLAKSLEEDDGSSLQNQLPALVIESKLDSLVDHLFEVKITLENRSKHIDEDFIVLQMTITNHMAYPIHLDKINVVFEKHCPISQDLVPCSISVTDYLLLPGIQSLRLTKDFFQGYWIHTKTNFSIHQLVLSQFTIPYDSGLLLALSKEHGQAPAKKYLSITPKAKTLINNLKNMPLTFLRNVKSPNICIKQPYVLILNTTQLIHMTLKAGQSKMYNAIIAAWLDEIPIKMDPNLIYSRLQPISTEQSGTLGSNSQFHDTVDAMPIASTNGNKMPNGKVICEVDSYPSHNNSSTNQRVVISQHLGLTTSQIHAIPIPVAVYFGSFVQGKMNQNEVRRSLKVKFSYQRENKKTISVTKEVSLRFENPLDVKSEQVFDYEQFATVIHISVINRIFDQCNIRSHHFRCHDPLVLLHDYSAEFNSEPSILDSILKKNEKVEYAFMVRDDEEPLAPTSPSKTNIPKTFKFSLTASFFFYELPNDIIEATYHYQFTLDSYRVDYGIHVLHEKTMILGETTTLQYLVQALDKHGLEKTLTDADPTLYYRFSDQPKDYLIMGHLDGKLSATKKNVIKIMFLPLKPDIQLPQLHLQNQVVGSDCKRRDVKRESIKQTYQYETFQIIPNSNVIVICSSSTR